MLGQIIWLAPVCKLASKSPTVMRLFDVLLRFGEISSIKRLCLGLHEVYYDFPRPEKYKILGST